MIIETITSRDTDTEICVTCPDCKAFEYFDPRPWHHCINCMEIRVNDFIRKCTDCGCDKPATGDVHWLNVCTTVEKETYEKLKELDANDPEILKVLKR